MEEGSLLTVGVVVGREEGVNEGILDGIPESEGDVEGAVVGFFVGLVVGACVGRRVVGRSDGAVVVGFMEGNVKAALCMMKMISAIDHGGSCNRIVIIARRCLRGR